MPCWCRAASTRRASSTSCSPAHGFDKCAIVTSYQPSPADIKGEETGEGLTEKLRQYDIYKKMLADWFKEDPDEAVKRPKNSRRR